MFEVTALPTESQSFPIFNVFTQNAILPNMSQLWDRRKKKKITPIKDGGSNFELSEKGSEKESRSHNKTNI